MSFLVLVYAVFAVLVLILFYLRYALSDFSRSLTNVLEDNARRHDSLPRFSHDIFFTNPPATIDITNPHECTMDAPKLCDMDDVRTCFGCQNLTARCVHFDDDQVFISTDTGQRTVLPKNASAREGYCLVTHRLADVCNPFHGDLVFVESEPGSREMSLICSCKNPGLVGNTRLDGSCSTPFVCNGSVVDINRPLDELTCVCDTAETSVTVNGVPTCQVKSVLEATRANFESLLWNTDTVDVSNYHQDIANNMASPKLINPCSFCILTGVAVNAVLVHAPNTNTYYCLNRDNRCLPVRRSAGGRILRGDYGPDGVISLPWHGINYYGHLSSNPAANMAIVVNASEVPDALRSFLNFTQTTGFYYIDAADHDLSLFYTLHAGPTRIVPPRIGCQRYGLTYTCDLSTLPNGLTGGTRNWPDFQSLTVGLLRFPQPRPPAFIWGTELWVTSEAVNPLLQLAQSQSTIDQRYRNHIIVNPAIYATTDDGPQQVRFLYLQMRASNSPLAQLRWRVVRAKSHSAWNRFIQYTVAPQETALEQQRKSEQAKKKKQKLTATR